MCSSDLKKSHLNRDNADQVFEDLDLLPMKSTDNRMSVDSGIDLGARDREEIEDAERDMQDMLNK